MVNCSASSLWWEGEAWHIGGDVVGFKPGDRGNLSVF